MYWVVAFGGSDCERIGAGLLAQPVNAVSTLAYVVAAIAVLKPARRATGTRRLILAGYASSLAAVGVGSFAYHGPQPSWAEWAHDGALALAVVLAIAVAAAAPALRAWPRPATTALWTVMTAAALAYVAGRTGSPTCLPRSPLQPHAAWHVLSAAAAALLAVSPQAVRRARRSG